MNAALSPRPVPQRGPATADPSRAARDRARVYWRMAWQLARTSRHYPATAAQSFVARAWCEATGLPWHCAQSAAKRALWCLEARRVAAFIGQLELSL
jgi:hypothetical protein